ncbi:MAG: phytoene/squalene synthase family protein [Ignavibacteriaceae bacterium]|nr:phytoene/squalene synthase family protein [Ignavibacteriaceae bacterium]
MELYNITCSEMSKLLTKRYSTSFSLGIRAFDKKYRDPIYSIYAYVRVADEIVDTFHGFDKLSLLKEFRKDTYRAIKTCVSTNPVLHAFQEVVNRYNVDIEFIDAFLDSMEMDLYNGYYEQTSYDKYIYGSAEVVGLMCLRVFVNGDQSEFDKLRESARALGSAFQKVNFLRDIRSDIEERGRIYLPGVNKVAGIDDINKAILEESIENEFAIALEGIRQLPQGVRLGVYSAYSYYLNLFNRIRASNVEVLLKKRVRVPNWKKLILLSKSIIEVKILKTC